MSLSRRSILIGAAALPALSLPVLAAWRDALLDAVRDDTAKVVWVQGKRGKTHTACRLANRSISEWSTAFVVGTEDMALAAKLDYGLNPDVHVIAANSLGAIRRFTARNIIVDSDLISTVDGELLPLLQKRCQMWAGGKVIVFSRGMLHNAPDDWRLIHIDQTRLGYPNHARLRTPIT